MHDEDLIPIAIQRLAALERTVLPTVVSCYVRLEVEDRPRKRFLVALKDQIKAIEATLEQTFSDREERNRVQRDLSRVFERLGTNELPSAHGAAVFACEERGLFEVIPLPWVIQTRIAIDTIPLLAELVEVSGHMGHVLVVALDRRVARFFDVSAFDVVELEDLAAINTRGGKFHSSRGDSPGWGERHFHQRIEEERHRHYAEINATIHRMTQTRVWSGLVLAGPTDHVKAMHRFLEPRLTSKVMGDLRCNPTVVTPSEIQVGAFASAQAHQAEDDLRLVRSLEKSVGEGWAVNGSREALRAMARGRLRLLIVPEGQRGGGFLCGDTGRLVLATGDCRGEGVPVPITNLVDRAIEEAVRQRVKVVVVREPRARRSIDGLAGFLRFR